MTRSIVFLLLCLYTITAQGKVNVFTCEPEWSSLVTELGGDDVSVYTATTAFQDPHRVEARPSLIAKMRRADLLVCSGADLEVGWLPLLLRSSSNKNVQVGQPGYFEAALQVERMHVPHAVDRSMGDVHIQGNPHVHLDPRRLAVIAENLTQRLAEIDPNNADAYRQRSKDFLSRWNEALVTWNEKAAPLKGLRAVVHHKDWAYLFDWLGMVEVATLEPKPGITPSTGHLTSLLSGLEATPAQVIVFAVYQQDKPAQWLSKRAEIPAVKLPFTVGGSDQAKDLFALMDETIALLLEATQ